MCARHFIAGPPAQGVAYKPATALVARRPAIRFQEKFGTAFWPGMGESPRISLCRNAWSVSEMDDEAERRTDAIGGIARVAQADVIQLRTQSQVREKTDINAAADAVSKLV
jgi:hypothetical protein